MRQLAYALPQLPGLPIRAKTYAAWPVWSGSTTAEIKWPKVVKRAVIAWYHKARDWNARKEAIARYGGTLGSAAMRVLESFTFDFQNWHSGQLDPTYEQIAAKTGLGRTTVWTALTRLKQLGLLHSQQRAADHWENGQYRLKQISNAYMLMPPTQWRGLDLPPEPPPPDPETWGATPPLSDVMAQAVDERQQGGSIMAAIRILETDETDDLAAALASYGRARQAAEENDRNT